MKHFFSYIDIENFKSIKNLRIDGCKRINLFIGPPNVGKSNILEALSLFSLPYFRFNSPKRLDIFIRINQNQLPELFYNGNYENPINITTSEICCHVVFKKKDGFLEIDFKKNENENKLIDHIKSNNKLYLRNGSVVSNKKFISNVNRYIFNIEMMLPSYSSQTALLPPFGNNLASCIEEINEIKTFIKSSIEPYNLKIRFNKGNEEVKFIKIIEDYELEIPFNLIADTLQRMIFFKTAIKSNENSILLFEEPEAQCYPPYIKELTQEIVDSETNQFFIATHSDIVVNHFLENAFDETTIYMVDFKDGQTVVQPLTEQQKLDIVNDGIDIFFNRDYFLTSNN